MNKSLAWINNVQIAKSWSFATQSYSKCTRYLSGAEVYLQDISFEKIPSGDCFTTNFHTQEQPIPEWKVRLFLFRETMRSRVN